MYTDFKGTISQGGQCQGPQDRLRFCEYAGILNDLIEVLYRMIFTDVYT